VECAKNSCVETDYLTYREVGDKSHDEMIEEVEAIQIAGSIWMNYWAKWLVLDLLVHLVTLR